MSNIFRELGIDEQDVKWYHIAACKNMNINWFFDDYEADKELAKQIDELCLNCPIVKQCFNEAVSNKEHSGVWGGVYFNLGKPDKKHNSHKTPEVWQALRKLHGKKNIL